MVLAPFVYVGKVRVSCTATSGPKNHPQVIDVLLAELGQI